MKKREQASVGFLGFGTVGAGAVRILQEHREEITARLGSEIVVKAVCSPSIESRDTSWVDSAVIKTADPQSVIDSPDIDIVVEAIGGFEPARTFILQAIDRGKSVVTANKLLLAAEGAQIARAAAERGVSLGIEASVAGGIPILNAVREGLVGERFESIYAILNGTSNYILTEMEKKGRPFAQILAAAQQLGYAEADPSLDIDGIDARDKLALLATLCFGVSVNASAIPTTGIARLRPVDFVFAKELGYALRLICMALRSADGGFAFRVSPALVRLSSMMANVDGPFNAIELVGAAAGRTFYYGRGAGGGPTGIAVVSDIVRAAREIIAGTSNLSRVFGLSELKPWAAAPSAEFVSSYVVRFIVNDRTGIIAEMAELFARFEINIENVMREKECYDRRELPFIVKLEAAPFESIERALQELGKLDYMVEPPLALPIEEQI